MQSQDEYITGVSNLVCAGQKMKMANVMTCAICGAKVAGELSRSFGRQIISGIAGN